MTETQTWLAKYVAHGSETAFRELMQSHLNFVYSTAHRLAAGDTQLAQDITQTVFLDLARAANTLPADTQLGGWLHRHTCYVAAKSLRTERRRRTRERQAMEMQELHASSSDDHQVVAPVLDDAINGLEAADRTLILLRFFEQQSFGLIGENLGVKEDAARMRLNRALEKLASMLKRRGVKSTSAALAALLTSQAVQAAPTGLAATIAAALFAEGAAPAALVATTKALTMTLFQKLTVTAALTIAVGAGIYEAKQAANARAEARTLRTQQASLADQLQRLQSAGDPTPGRLADLRAENVRLKANAGQGELLKLRGEVGQLRRLLQDLPSTRADRLRQKLAQMPDRRTPEMTFLTDKDWINAAWNADLDTDDGIRLALSKLRDEATDTFLNLTRTALKKYLAANDNQLPADLLALKSYYDTPVTDAMLARYALMQSGKWNGNPGDSVVRKAVYADPDYDSNQEMSLSGGGGGSFNRVHDAISDAVVAFTLANNGQPPGDPSQLTAYLKRPVDAAALQKYFDPIVADMASNAPPPAVAAWLVPALKAYGADHAGQLPRSPADLQPYLATPEQQAELQKLAQYTPLGK